VRRPSPEPRDSRGHAAEGCPQSWYLVAAARDLDRPGRIVATEVGDEALIVYRGAGDGQVRALAAHCAHLGAHLRHGRVVGDGIRCALHHRVFDGTGLCRGLSGGTAHELRQPTFRVLERHGGVWVFLGEGEPFDFPVPALAAGGDVATRLISPRRFPISWRALIANGCDIDHLQTVHHRRLRAEPEFLRPAPHRMEVAYEASVTGRGLSDRLMGYLAGDRIRARISCLGGSLMLVESALGERRSFLMLSMVPSSGGTTIRGVAGIAAAPGAAGRLKARVAAWLFTSFLERDVEFLEGLRLHRPPSEATLGDRFMNRVFDYLEGVPLYRGHRGWTAA
jgi:nitrite reductase/ring-hydroxylating ferredoxin subunit